MCKEACDFYFNNECVNSCTELNMFIDSNKNCVYKCDKFINSDNECIAECDIYDKSNRCY